MKTTGRIVQFFVIVFCSISTTSFSQFVVRPSGPNQFGECDVTNQQIESIGIGEFYSNNDVPQAALDVRVPYLQPNAAGWIPSESFQTTTATDWANAWRMFSGLSTTGRMPKFTLINVDGSSTTPGTSKYDIEQIVEKHGNMIFKQNAEPVPTFPIDIRERLRIYDGLGGNNNGSFTTPRVTKISISHDGKGNQYLPKAQAMLNMGSTYPYPATQQAGNRPWMDVGTYMTYGSDNMYVGLKDTVENPIYTISNIKDAVINWGDDIDSHPDKDAEVLRFIFTGYQFNGSNTNPYDYNSFQGLEVARMTPHGTMGIGVGFNRQIIPKARLDIFDDGTGHGSYVSKPQLRLSNKLNNASNLGIYTDFNTNSNGYLLIDPKTSASGTLVNGRVGIGTASPISTLHVYGSIGSGTGAITSDYLNHSNTPPPLPLSPSLPYLIYSNGNGTLNNLPPAGSSVDILHGDGSWSPAGSGTGNVSSCSGILTNYIPVFDASSNICKSDLYDYNYQVGLNNTSPLATFHVTPHGSDAPLIISNSSSDKVLFVNSDDHVSIGSNTTLGTGGGTPCRLWVKGLTSGSSSSADNLVLTDALGHHFFKASDDGKIMIGGYYPNNNNTGPEARVSINTGNVSDYVNLVVRTSYSTVGTNDERALGVLNGSGSHLLTCWADEHVTMGYSGAQTSNDARLIVNTLNNGESAYFSGHIFYGSASAISDSTFKINAQPIRDSRSILNSLNPKSYNFDISNNPGMNLPSGIHYGMYAQEIERVLPDLVIQENSPAVYDTSGNLTIPSRSFKSVNYTELIPFLTQALKEQQSTIDSISTTLANLQQRLDICCPAPSNRTIQGENNTIDISLSSVQAIILNQNDPNPFSEKTQISFVIPDEVKTAEIIFYTSSGTVLKNIVVSSRGEGQMNVYASDLSSGVYYYSLVADGKTIATKKMVCNK